MLGGNGSAEERRGVDTGDKVPVGLLYHLPALIAVRPRLRSIRGAVWELSWFQFEDSQG
jgi:hypothetical protein